MKNYSKMVCLMVIVVGMILLLCIINEQKPFDPICHNCNKEYKLVDCEIKYDEGRTVVIDSYECSRCGASEKNWYYGK